MNSNEDINGLLARHFAHEGLTPRQQSVLDSCELVFSPQPHIVPSVLSPIALYPQK